MSNFEILYLGTAAAEGLPAVFCNCPTCLTARKKGGKNIRTRSQILVNNDLLLDFPMDTYMHAVKHKLDLSAIKHVFITHAHMDHCYPQEFIMHGSPYAHGMTSEFINIYGDKAVLEAFAEQTRHEMRDDISKSVILHELKPYTVTYADKYKVTALPAQHTVGEDCMVYLVEYGGKSLLLLNDTGILPDSVYDFLKDILSHIDIVSFDCTYGYMEKGAGRHMGMLDAVKEREKLSARGLTDERTIYAVTHFSHNGACTHSKLKKLAKPLNFTVAYDGLKIKL